MTLEQTIHEYLSLELEQVIDYRKFRDYAIVTHSCTIEGSALTELDTWFLLEEGITPKGKLLVHSLMVKDHFEALQFVLHEAENQQPVTIKLIQGIAAKVLKSTGKTYLSNAEFRKRNVSAGVSHFPDYAKLESLMNELVSRLQQQLTPYKSPIEALELAHTAHFDLVSIHPFYDGNGRTSRLLMNYIQAYYNLPLGLIFKEDRLEYFDALVNSRKQENMAFFQKFMKAQYKKMLDAEIKAFKQMKEGKPLIPKIRKNDGRGKSIFF